jgi:hypothetical protein
MFKLLEKDVLGLLEVLNKVSLYYYKEFGVNIIKYRSIPSLAISVFGFNFYYEKYQIKLINGALERFIKVASFGKNVGVILKKLKEGYTEQHIAYHYDMNSQSLYPKARLNTKY